jgi:hypothetical protein
MRNDVQLLGDDRGRNALMPELTSVFKAVRDQGPMHRAQQLYFNAWMIHALLHHDTNTFITFQARPTTAMTLAFRHAQYAGAGDYYITFHGLTDEQLDSKIRNVRNVLSVFSNRLETANIAIPYDMRRIAQTALAFNADLDKTRRSLNDNRNDALKSWSTRLAGENPLVAAVMASYLMHTLGHAVTKNTDEKYVQEKYSCYAQMASAIVPQNFDMALAGEAVCMDAVQILRDIYKRAEDIIWDAPSAFMPADMPAERMLLESIRSYTQVYGRAKKPEIAPVIGSTPNNVVSLFGARSPT